MREEIITKVHKKEIDTDVILNFSAVAPTKWKRELILWFVIFIIINKLKNIYTITSKLSLK